MTIAVSVMVSSSRLLAFAVRGMATLAVLAISLVLFVNVNLSAIFRFQILLIASILLWTVIFKLQRPGKTFHIDISGIGQMRLTQYSGVSASTHTSRRPLDAKGADLVQMLSDSTLWPHLLVLRLKLENGTVVAIPVLPDSVRGQGFHELSVACRWIAARA